jgi:hypothetical protein
MKLRGFAFEDAALRIHIPFQRSGATGSKLPGDRDAYAFRCSCNEGDFICEFASAVRTEDFGIAIFELLT